MTETAERPTASTPTTEPPPPPPPAAHGIPGRGRPNRVYQLLAWVGIVAGVVFIVAVVFFSGFILGKHSGGGGHGHFGSHQGRGVHFFHRMGLPPMGPMGPMAPQFGPGGPTSPSTPSPTTVPSPPR